MNDIDETLRGELDRFNNAKHPSLLSVVTLTSNYAKTCKPITGKSTCMAEHLNS